MIDDNKQLESNVMDAIRSGKVRMVPRWRHVLSSVLAALGAVILLCTLLYVVSFAVFMLRENGALFMPVFGMRGFQIFLGALPVFLVGLVVAFVLILEVLVRRYSFVYRKPLLVSVVAVLLIVIFGGIALERTHIHGELYREARHHLLPAPLNAMYQAGVPRVPQVERGTIVALTPEGFVITNLQDPGTTTVIIDRRTRTQYGASFEVGQQVVVFGGEASGTIRALGIGGVSD